MIVSTAERKTRRKLLLLYAPLLYISLGTMISIYSSRDPLVDWGRLLMSFVGIMALFFTTSKARNKVFAVVLCLVVLILVVSVNFYLIANVPTPRSFLYVGDAVTWASVLYLSYRISYKGVNAMNYSTLLAYSIPVFVLIYLSVNTYLLLNRDSDSFGLISTAYYPLFLLPFALMMRNKYVKWTLVLFIFSSILLSSKRGGFIAFWGALIAYFYVEFKMQKAFSRVKTIIGAVVALGLVVMFMNDFVQQNDLSIFDRLGNIEEDNGSGRGVVYAYTWDMITSSRLPSLLFGHGFNTVFYDSALGLSAHNDALEVIYDYGIIGMILYVLFYVRLIPYYKKLKKFKPQCAAPFAASLVLVLVLSTVAHLIIYPTHFLFVCAFWGICMGECDKMSKRWG